MADNYIHPLKEEIEEKFKTGVTNVGVRCLNKGGLTLVKQLFSMYNLTETKKDDCVYVMIGRRNQNA